MQEEFKNKLKRTAKKLAAIGTGALVAGSTMVGAALAADLSGLPAPFITSGAFDAYIVVGTSAATITAATLQDIQGSIELATALGQLATTSAGAEGSATLSLRQFTGENLDGMGVETGIANTYHEDKGSTWGDLGASSTLVALDDIVFTRSDSSVYNATVALDLDDNYVELNRDNLAVHINSSTDSVNVFTVTLGTNRTSNGFEEGDSLNWFGNLYEVVDVLTDGNVSLGSTSEVSALKGESFTIGGSSFTFESVATSGTQVSILDAAGARHFVNSTYSTIGNIQLRIKTGTVFASDVVTTATFETVENSYKFALGDTWPIDTDFVVESMTVDTTNANVTAIVLRNNRTYELGAKGAEVEIANGLNFIYSDNTANNATAAAVGLGGVGGINITETAGVSLSFTADGRITIGGVALSLPGVNFFNYLGSTKTAITDNETYPASGLYPMVAYGLDNSTGLYEFAINYTSTADGSSRNVTWARPSQVGTITSAMVPSYSPWTTPSDNTNYTTPSGIVIGTTVYNGNNNTLILKVSAVQIDIDASTYYGRKGSSWSEPKYSIYGDKVNWVAGTSTTGTVTVSEPTGKSLSAVVTFQTDDDAVFARAADITFGGTVLTANNTASDLTSDYGSNIAYEHNGTYIQSATDPIESSTPGVDDKLIISSPRKDIVIGVGALQDVEVTLDTDAATSTPVNATIGNTTVTLSSGSGSSVSVNKISPGFSKLDSEITTSTLAKPVILMGGSGINGLVKNLKDSGLYDASDLLAQGTGHAKVAFVENAFNSQTALVIAGYSGSDTLMASRAIASALLNGQPFSFADQASANLVLNTGTSVVNDVSVMS